MDAMQNLLTRRSDRKYKPDMVPQEKLDKILEGGTYAATGMGRQSPIILAVTDKAMRDRLSKMNAAIMGVDVVKILNGAKEAAQTFGPQADVKDNAVEIVRHAVF